MYALLAAEVRNTLLTAKTFQNDADLFFSSEFAADFPFDFPNYGFR